jgi:hypothetical protein
VTQETCAEPRVETRVEDAVLTVFVNGEYRKIPAQITIVDTYYANGRKDVTVQVPTLITSPETQDEET